MCTLPVYLDNNATTPVDPRVLEAMLPYFTTHYGNAASKTHAYGWQAAEAVDIAREQVAELIGAEPGEIIFTSGATESDNLAIKGVFEAYAAKGNHIITVATEHKAVLDTCKHIEKLGADVTYLPVNSAGMIDVQQLEAAIKPATVLIAIMYANNETGVIQPVRQIAAIAKKYNIIFFSDAAQAAGKIPVNVLEDGTDLLALSAHKMYGPKGIGVLFVRRKNPRVRLAEQMNGGGHERGMRSGTLNVPAIAGLGKACELCRLEMEGEATRIRLLRDKLQNALLQVEGTFVNGDRINRLPNIVNMSFAGTEAQTLMTALVKDIAVSSGSACTSASIEPSYVLKALGVPDEFAYGAIRFGLGRFTTGEEIDFTIGRVVKAVTHIRQGIVTAG
ncbi:MAG TPA: IscS subfamily cysteine desulfurase [Chitinophagaceae bacterium]|nr:IscS subfamily cysteine desulfurase [Chitinophagaceae bacterium]